MPKRRSRKDAVEADEGKPRSRRRFEERRRPHRSPRDRDDVDLRPRPIRPHVKDHSDSPDNADAFASYDDYIDDIENFEELDDGSAEADVESTDD